MNQAKFFTALLDRPWTVVITVLTVLLLSAAGLNGLSKTNSYRAFLDDDYPTIVELDTVEAMFVDNKTAYVLVIPSDKAIFTAQTIAVLRDLTEDSWLMPHVRRVDSLVNFQYTQAQDDQLNVNPLVPRGAELTHTLLQHIKRVSLSEPGIRKFLVSETADVAAINITFDFGGQDVLSQVERDAVAAQVLKLLKQYRVEYPDIDFRASGGFFVDYYADVYLAKVSELLTPMMVLVMVVLLAILLRSFSGVFMAVVVVIFSGTITMGIFGWAEMLLEAVAILSPIVVMTLAVADSVHVIVGAQSALGQGFSKRDAILESLRVNFMPVLLTSLTTALGIITFVFTDFPSLRKLGLIVAVGVTVAFILSVTLLPVLMQWLPLRAIEKNADSRRRVNVLADFVIAQHRKIVPIALLVSVIVSGFMVNGTIDESFSTAFKPHTRIAESIAITNDKMAGILRVDVAVQHAEKSQTRSPAASDLEFLRTIEQFQKWSMEQPHVTHVSSIVDTYKRLNKSLHDDDLDWYRLPERADQTAQYMLLYELSLPYGFDLSNQVSFDKSATLVTISANDASSANVVAMTDDIKRWFAENAPELHAMPTGIMAVMSDVTYRHLIPNMAKGAMIAILMVSLVLFVALRSWLLGFFGMLANIIPIGIGYGIWGMSGGLYNFAVIAVAGVCLGMVVDFAVHFIDKFRHGLKRRGSAENAVRYAYEKVASPLFITALVLICGFATIGFTESRSLAGLGLLTPIIIGAALIFDLLVLPAILLLVYSRADRVRR